MIVTPRSQFINKNTINGDPKVAVKPKPQNHFVERAKIAFENQKRKINKDNVIYYFAGFTLIVIFIVYAAPIIYFNFTKRNEEVSKIVFTKEDKKDNSAAERLIFSKDNIAIKEVKPRVSKLYSSPNPDAMKSIFKETLSNSKVDTLYDYFEPDAKLFLWKPSEAGNGCCEIERATPEYILNYLEILNLERPVWNFDQNQPDIKGIQDIEGRFKDSYIGVSNKDALVGIKLSAKNRISEVVATTSIKEMYKSVAGYSENNKNGFQKVILTEEEIRQLNQNK
jgi:hypothetical protein